MVTKAVYQKAKSGGVKKKKKKKKKEQQMMVKREREREGWTDLTFPKVFKHYWSNFCYVTQQIDDL